MKKECKSQLINFIMILSCLTASIGYSNNLSITNLGLTPQETTAIVSFNISWNNSWRTSSYESNWDASWIFIKYRKDGESTWKHATLCNSGHSAPSGSTISTSNDGKGIFIYKSTDGIGSNEWNDVKILWNYNIDGLRYSDKVEIGIFGIEMVYIPQGSFYVGDGTVANISGQLEDKTSGNPYMVTSENAITLGGGGANCLGNNNAYGMSSNDDFNDATSKALPAAFPKGYKAFYCMKYEISQGQYIHFLNKLTYTQQASRTATAPNSNIGKGAFNNRNRNGIDIKISGTNPSTPAVYANNLDGDAIFNEANDGENIACNHLRWADLAAYLDWVGLRPMTELEYEKACRGNQYPVSNEYAWGTSSITEATSISNSGNTNEIAGNIGSNAIYNNNASIDGPMRVGCFAQSASDRASSGGSYYGIMDLSGNVWERAITIGSSYGREFTGNHGDGYIDTTGNNNVTNWPGTEAFGIGFKGGSWYNNDISARTSDRSLISHIQTIRDEKYGGRGVRTAP